MALKKITLAVVSYNEKFYIVARLNFLDEKWLG